jgi:spermidine synthase
MAVVSALFEELDYRATPMGALSLRRRRLLSLGVDVFEVILGDEHLMSTLFTEGERALARIGLSRVVAPGPLDVAVGGLGLGYTAQAALEDSRVGSLLVLDVMEAVIDWFERGLVPLAETLRGDARCRIAQGDFFRLLADEPACLDPTDPGRRFDAVLLDIDHSPRHALNASHAPFYGPQGLGRLRSVLKPSGVFALWSDDPPDPEFESALAAAFDWSGAEIVEFANPLTGGRSGCTIYVAGYAAAAGAHGA